MDTSGLPACDTETNCEVQGNEIYDPITNPSRHVRFQNPNNPNPTSLSNWYPRSQTLADGGVHGQDNLKFHHEGSFDKLLFHRSLLSCKVVKGLGGKKNRSNRLFKI